MQRVSEKAVVSCQIPEHCTINEGVRVKQSTLGNRITLGKDTIVLSSQISDFCNIEKRNLVRSSTIGRMTYTGSDTSIMWAEIGSFCCISRLIDIGGNEHNYHAVTMMPTYEFKNLSGGMAKHPEEEMIRVGNDVWIGAGVSIVRKPGLTIGDGAVLGGGAVVTKSVPPYAIVAGVPAKVIGYRFSDEIIAELLELKWWDWPMDKIKANWKLLSSDLTPEIIEELKKS